MDGAQGTVHGVLWGGVLWVDLQGHSTLYFG